MVQSFVKTMCLETIQLAWHVYHRTASGHNMTKAHPTCMHSWDILGARISMDLISYHVCGSFRMWKILPTACTLYCMKNFANSNFINGTSWALYIVAQLDLPAVMIKTQVAQVATHVYLHCTQGCSCITGRTILTSTRWWAFYKDKISITLYIYSAITVIVIHVIVAHTLEFTK